MDYYNEMKQQSLFLLPLCIFNLFGSDDSFLSPQKKELLQQQKNRYESEYEKLRTDWVAPINLNGSYSQDKSALGLQSDTQTVSASLSQDIFRSGGITYQIHYADAKKQTETIALKQHIATLNQQLFIALLTYQKNSVLLKQSQKRLENKEIEIFIKRQLFDIGKADITELNNAFMEKSNELKNITSLKYALIEQQGEIQKISDLNPADFILPQFRVIEKDDFLSHQLDLEYIRAQSDTLKYLTEVTSSRYLPAISLNANVGYRDYNPKESNGAHSGHYYSSGVQISMPLTYNASATIQEARATYLQQAAKTADKIREVNATYKQIIEKIGSYREYIAITSNNLLLYDELIRALQAGVNAGTKTGYDLQTLKNTKKIEELEIEINEITIQILLAQLHFAINPSKELL
jgi:outer membrane protein